MSNRYLRRNGNPWGYSAPARDPVIPKAPKDKSHLTGCEPLAPFTYKGLRGLILSVNHKDAHDGAVHVLLYPDNDPRTDCIPRWILDVENIILDPTDEAR